MIGENKSVSVASVSTFIVFNLEGGDFYYGTVLCFYYCLDTQIFFLNI